MITAEATSGVEAGKGDGETLGVGAFTTTSGLALDPCSARHPNQPAAASKNIASAEPKTGARDSGRKEVIAATKRRQRPSAAAPIGDRRFSRPSSGAT